MQEYKYFGSRSLTNGLNGLKDRATRSIAQLKTRMEDVFRIEPWIILFHTVI